MLRTLFLIGLSMLASAVIASATSHAFAQECPSFDAAGPSIPSQARTLEGRLIFHDGIRQWFELKLDRPQCEQSSIQLEPTDSTSNDLETLRGCRVRSSGILDSSPTGYYSLDIFQTVKEIGPASACSKKPPFPDHSGSKPDQSISAYRVDMHVRYPWIDRPPKFRVWSAGRELRPWQAYASYLLTGGFVLYGHCGEGFVVDKVFGSPKATPEHFDNPRTPSDMAMFDPFSAVQSGQQDLHLGYTCVRAPPQGDPDQ